ncbi:MAG TPA: acyl-CoA dehydrogenase, partial [Ruminococcaceae bacterium]|nr:acyl-CoA dehydrogenase [Oscillospiraceae bacterium]
MDFILSKEQEMARTLFREVAENEIKPLAAEIDEEERFPEEALKLFRKYKFMGIPYSKEYGGAGCDTLTYEMCVEEISKACAATGTMLSAHTSLGTWPIV